MGGLGSGSWYRWDSKYTVEQCHRLDIRYLKRQGWLKPGYFGSLYKVPKVIFFAWLLHMVAITLNRKEGYIHEKV